MRSLVKKMLVALLASLVMGSTLFAQGASEPVKTAEAKPVTIMIGYENNPGEPIDTACQKWKELVEAKSNGTMKVDLYPSSQLGSKDNLLDQATNGDPVITLANGAFFQDRGIKDFGIVFAPYLFETWNDIDKLVASDWWKQKDNEMSSIGLKILTSWHYGIRHTMTIDPVNKVSDLKGKKIRVPNNNIQVKGFVALGATPTPMSLGDVYTALQQHTIDGLENPLPVLLNGNYQEVSKYLVLDGHIFDQTCWVAGTSFLKTLSTDQVKLLMDCGDEAGVFNNSLLDKTTIDALEKLKAAGVKVTEVPHADFVEASESFYNDADIKKMWSVGLIDQIKGILAN